MCGDTVGGRRVLKYLRRYLDPYGIGIMMCNIDNCLHLAHVHGGKCNFMQLFQSHGWSDGSFRPYPKGFVTEPCTVQRPPGAPAQQSHAESPPAPVSRRRSLGCNPIGEGATLLMNNLL